MTTESYPDLEKLCRLCLRTAEQSSALVHIFPPTVDATGNDAPPLSIPMRIMACAALEVQSNDGLPKSICTECRYQLEKSYYFRKRSQLSDSKLRKHIRLLSLGKKSRVFSKASHDDELEDDDELEFEDSVRFIAEEDALLQEQKREEWRQKLEEEMHRKIAEHKEQCELELREKLREELRSAVIDEVKLELRAEQAAKELEMRAAVRDECLASARVEVRAEVAEDCRQLERELLLNELDKFLKAKRSNADADVGTKSFGSTDASAAVGPEKGERLGTHAGRRTTKRSAASPLGRQIRILKVESAADESDAPATDSTNAVSGGIAAAVPFESVSMDNEASSEVVENETETEQNYYIYESDDGNENEEMDGSTHEQGQTEDGAYYEKKLKVENFQLTASESGGGGSETASYQIKSTGEIQYCKKSCQTTAGEEGECDAVNEEMDEDVIVFNFEEDLDGEHSDAVELGSLDLAKKIILLKSIEQSRSKVECDDDNDNEEDAVAMVTDSPPSFTKRINGSHNSAVTSAANTSKSAEAPMLRATDTAKTFKCTSCPMVYSTENSLNRHLRIHRKIEQRGLKYQCPVCHIYLSCKSALTRHMVIHTGERPYVCEECGKSFVQREILKRHMHTHTGERPHKCPHCYRSFTQRVTLTHHITRQHSVGPVLQQFCCHLCPKRFNHASGLSRHLASHSGLTFQCTKCKRKFGDRSSVKRHIANVHGKAGSEKQTQLTPDEEEALQRSDDNSVEFNS